jgi:hypothetical protein
MDRVSLIAVAVVAMLAPAAAAEEPGPSWLDKLRRSQEAVEWSDVAVRHDWRLQERPRDGRFRILDPRDDMVRQGSAEACRAAFAGFAADGTIPPLEGPAVIVLHGLGEGRSSMRPLADHLRKTLGATVLLFGYASTAAPIEAHGRSLDAVIGGLPPDARLSFVGHSLGNLVVRRWMSLANDRDLARVDRMVMLGPPNRGSELARQVGGVGMLAALADGAARDLVVDWPQVEPHLAVPPCEFGIVAGGRGDGSGFSPLLDGDDDAVVRVEETRLDGAGDFLLVPVHHEALLRDQRVKQATESFLKSGRFAADRAEAVP